MHNIQEGSVQRTFKLITLVMSEYNESEWELNIMFVRQWYYFEVTDRMAL